jgi:hypothetical protein
MYPEAIFHMVTDRFVNIYMHARNGQPGIQEGIEGDG